MVRARLAVVLFGAFSVVVATLTPAGAAPPLAPAAAAVAADPCAVPLDNDPRLGPATLPTTGAVGLMVRGYQRFGHLTKDQFLARYWDPSANGGRGSYLFPPDNGFLFGIQTVGTVHMGMRLDRFGSEFGAFLAPALTPYAQRAIPPQSLNTFDPAYPCNYHAYLVLKSFRLRLGPIAPWFEQPGKGLQDNLDASLVPGAPTPLSVLWLVDHGYLQRLN